MKTIKKCIAYFLLFVFVIQSAGPGSLTCEAADGYFASGKIYCHIIAKNEVEVCGLRVGKVKGILDIPEKVAYRGKTYMVTRIADMEYADDEPLYYSIDAHKEEVLWPDWRYYCYFDTSGNGISIGNITDIPCSSIKKLVLPKTLTYIGEGAFHGCNKLKEVKFAKKYKKLVIGECAFGGKALKTLNFPEGTVEIGDFATGTTPNLTIPSSVKKIGAGVVNSYTETVKISKKNKNFKMKSGILYSHDEKILLGASAKTGSKVSISPKTTKLIDQSFYRSRVSEADLGGNVKEIQKGAFAECSNLQKVTGIGQDATIGYGAFSKCAVLTDLGDVSGVKEIKDDAFDGDSMLTLPISEKMWLADEALCGAKKISRIHVTVPENDPVYSIENGLLLKQEKTGKVVLLQMEDMEKVEVPEGVTRLAVALGDIEICREVILPESLKRQESWIYIKGGSITYRAPEVPEFCKHFFIKGIEREGENHRIERTSVFVPKNVLKEYKKKMAKAADESEGEDGGVDLWGGTSLVLRGV